MKYKITNFTNFCEVEIPKIASLNYEFDEQTIKLVQKTVKTAGAEVIADNFARRKEQKSLPMKWIRRYVGFSLFHFFKAREKKDGVNLLTTWKFALQNPQFNKMNASHQKRANKHFESKVKKVSEMDQEIACTFFESAITEEQLQKKVKSIINNIKSISDLEALIGSTKEDAMKNLVSFVVVMLNDIVGGKISIKKFH